MLEKRSKNEKQGVKVEPNDNFLVRFLRDFDRNLRRNVQQTKTPEGRQQLQDLAQPAIEESVLGLVGGVKPSPGAALRNLPIRQGAGGFRGLVSRARQLNTPQGVAELEQISDVLRANPRGNLGQTGQDAQRLIDFLGLESTIGSRTAGTSFQKILSLLDRLPKKEEVFEIPNLLRR